ncbi:bifunctional phosphoribosyl-AMP cyclohydrolase/phosphoribosyl-ATP diphosphatase HisIE [Petroclostridium sp. X23]|uniref:bifunctional phosphoribosyl-AMP cyclohydrolase/phosphoribosyl-ATP diphosphatase HisIE n=1 Tax=Petroclostridium sp. X23 TaxID=3045146 RepID=UPI0024AC9DB9|nr:bifunctional phosphoribosyl-AMP cyclohydrolase/phosphoribosyl-ATP diphosphatase HisIE [Petroclostridium sp. X23]WHH58911.1 bifunctional phosphoribosyl-AMP cyclohydrolase/phosphoribosyl-ATP diphosphatase HisIE [Petroclostridium sp. X23]
MNIVEQLKFDDKGLIPAIIQDHKTGNVLMMAYMNKESVEKTLETGKTVFWSRSRQKLWVKGETSGHYQYVKSISVDCDEDCLLIKVEQVGAACHTNEPSCFYREYKDGKLENASADSFDKAKVLQEVYDIIVDRVKNPKEGSYTNYLFEKGLDKMLKKVGEETAEVIIAAKNKAADEIRYEVSDLLYHLLVVLVERGLTLDEIYKELEGRK